MFRGIVLENLGSPSSYGARKEILFHCTKTYQKQNTDPNNITDFFQSHFVHAVAGVLLKMFRTYSKV